MQIEGLGEIFAARARTVEIYLCAFFTNLACYLILIATFAIEFEADA